MSLSKKKSHWISGRSNLFSCHHAENFARFSWFFIRLRHSQSKVLARGRTMSTALDLILTIKTTTVFHLICVSPRGSISATEYSRKTCHSSVYSVVSKICHRFRNNAKRKCLKRMKQSCVFFCFLFSPRLMLRSSNFLLFSNHVSSVVLHFLSPISPFSSGASDVIL